MNRATENQAVYRVRRSYRKDDIPKKYAGTYAIIDEATHQTMANCDLIGKAVFATLRITDHQNGGWQMQPNRKIMPSRWIVTDSSRNVAAQFDQKILGKMVNPLYKIALTVLDQEGKEVFRLVDPRTSIPDRVLGSGPNEWTLMSGDKPAAKLIRLPRQDKPAKGIFGKLKKMLAATDRGIISAGAEHALAAPVALGMILLFEELSDTSAAG
jgi:hypothetical protein